MFGRAVTGIVIMAALILVYAVAPMAFATDETAGQAQPADQDGSPGTAPTTAQAGSGSTNLITPTASTSSASPSDSSADSTVSGNSTDAANHEIGGNSGNGGGSTSPATTTAGGLTESAPGSGSPGSGAPVSTPASNSGNQNFAAQQSGGSLADTNAITAPSPANTASLDEDEEPDYELHLICGSGEWGIYWASRDDYNNRLLSVDYRLENRGTGTAYNVRVTGATANNGVIVSTPLPLLLGDLDANDWIYFTLKWLVPNNLRSFTTQLTLCADCEDNGDDDNEDNDDDGNNDDNGDNGNNDGNGGNDNDNNGSGNEGGNGDDTNGSGNGNGGNETIGDGDNNAGNNPSDDGDTLDNQADSSSRLTEITNGPPALVSSGYRLSASAERASLPDTGFNLLAAVVFCLGLTALGGCTVVTAACRLRKR